MKRTISIILVLALGLTVEVANADFTFGEAVNLGPMINTGGFEQTVCISADGLSLYFTADRPGWYGDNDIWYCTRPTKDDPWGPAENIGPIVNSSVGEFHPSISADELELYFERFEGGTGSDVYILSIWMTKRINKESEWEQPVRLNLTVPEGFMVGDPSLTGDGLELYFAAYRWGDEPQSEIYVTKRETKEAPWGEPINLGPVVNSWTRQAMPMISSDGLLLFFNDWWPGSPRPGGFGNDDIWFTRRATRDSNWSEPMNAGALINTGGWEWCGTASADGSTLYFSSDRPLGLGMDDVWQAPIIPIVDINGDGIVDAADVCIIIDYWGTDEPLCDIGPMPWGDGIVDVQDLIVLAEHLFEGIPPVEPEEVNVSEDDAGSQVELEQGQILVVTLESNPTTGYSWEVVETQESILEQMGEAEFKPSETGEPPLVGAGGWEILRFKAISAGQTSFKLVYHRPWEEGVEPVKTFSIQVVVN